VSQSVSQSKGQFPLITLPHRTKTGLTRSSVAVRPDDDNMPFQPILATKRHLAGGMNRNIKYKKLKKQNSKQRRDASRPIVLVRLRGSLLSPLGLGERKAWNGYWCD
jgi:hypothetical protein